MFRTIGILLVFWVVIAALVQTVGKDITNINPVAGVVSSIAITALIVEICDRFMDYLIKKFYN